MADIAWHRKYRPASFDDYMGDDVKKLVINRFKDRNSIPNTIMLYGTRGTGKTSMARLLSKEIHCMSPIDGHSCGKCEMCEAIDEYITSTEAGAECPGITEIDAATTTGKDDVNDIIEDALVPPLYPMKYKILILDECHMLSTSAQNSLLKVIEEPPEHLIFILCTTDPDKVIGTIHSRMQLKIEVKKKSVDEMADRLMYIAEQEGLTTSREALQIIAKKGDRIPRECINLLERVAKNNGNDVQIDTVRREIGEVSNQVYLDFFSAANNSLESILRFNKKLLQLDTTPKQFMSGLTRFVLDCLYVRHGVTLEDYPAEFLVQAKQIFSTYRTSDFDMLLQVIEDSSLNLDSDDTKSELIITNMALRIGKINLLAKGLVGQVDDAKDENIKSIRKYQQILEDKNKASLDRVQEIDNKKEQFAAIFPGISEIDTTGQIINIEEHKENDEMARRRKKISEIFGIVD